MNRATLCLVLAALALLAAAPARAQTKTGTSMGQFLQIEPAARTAAMGGAGVSLSEGLDGVYFNPATIADVDRYAGTFTHSAWLADIAYDYVAASIPVGKFGCAYAAVTSLNSGAIDVRTVSQPQGTGEQYTVSDVGIGLGYGRQITDRFSAGAQVTYVQETIWNSTANSFTVSVGTLYRVSEHGLHIGASLANFGTQTGYSGRDLRITYDYDPSAHGDNGALPGEVVTGEFPVPTLFRLGVGAPFQLSPQMRLDVEADAFHPSDNTESMSFGSELVYGRRFAARLGWENAFQQDAEGGLTAGAGFNSEWQDVAFHIDYGWADHGRLGNASRLTLGVGF
jgi:hypothetical protein